MTGFCVFVLAGSQVVLAHETGLKIWHDQGYRVKRPITFLGRYAKISKTIYMLNGYNVREGSEI